VVLVAGVDTEILRRLVEVPGKVVLATGVLEPEWWFCGVKSPEEEPVGLGSCPPWGRGRPGDLGDAYIMDVR
jgi:hypothetical protein